MRVPLRRARIFLRQLDSLRRVVGSRHWPSTTGRILESKVAQHELQRRSSPLEPDASTTVHRHVLEYEYQVGTKKYRSSRRYAEVLSVAGRSSWAESGAAEFPAGTEVQVFYDPQCPSSAALSPGLQGLHLVALAVPLAFAAIGAGVLLQLLRAWQSARGH